MVFLFKFERRLGIFSSDKNVETIEQHNWSFSSRLRPWNSNHHPPGNIYLEKLVEKNIVIIIIHVLLLELENKWRGIDKNASKIVRKINFLIKLSSLFQLRVTKHDESLRNAFWVLNTKHKTHPFSLTFWLPGDILAVFLYLQEYYIMSYLGTQNRNTFLASYRNTLMFYKIK